VVENIARPNDDDENMQEMMQMMMMSTKVKIPQPKSSPDLPKFSKRSKR